MAEGRQRICRGAARWSRTACTAVDRREPTLASMIRREQIIASDTLARAIESLRQATNARERAIPGSVAYEEAFVVEELLNALVLDLVRRRNRTALWPQAGMQTGRPSATPAMAWPGAPAGEARRR